jgi:hypothetical protein
LKPIANLDVLGKKRKGGQWKVSLYKKNRQKRQKRQPEAQCGFSIEIEADAL